MKTIEEQLVRTIDLFNLCNEMDIYSVNVDERNVSIRCNYAPSMTNMLVNVGFEYSIDVYGYLHFKRNGDEHIIMMNGLSINIKDINEKIKEVKNIIEKYISIPSGTIKSMGKTNWRPHRQLFQFLLVRLKAVEIGEKLG